MNKNDRKKMSVRTKALIYIAIMVLCGAAGYVFGRLAKRAELSLDIEGIKAAVKTAAVYAVPALYVILMTSLTVVACCIYAKTARAYKSLGKDDEDEMLRLENRLNTPVTILNICTILNLLFFSLMAEIIEFGDVSKPLSRILSAGGMILFILVYLMIFIMSRKCIELFKHMNPEKQGDLLDLNFQKKWEESHDEAQKMMMYKSAFKAFKAANYSCMVLWLICLMAQFVFRTGVLPVICVSAIWLIMTAVYCFESIKLEKQ